MICEGEGCCGGKEIPKGEEAKWIVLGRTILVPYCKLWRERMKKLDAEYDEKYLPRKSDK